MIKVLVKWPHANSPLLPEAGVDIELAADGLPLLLQVPIKPGERAFDVPDGTTKLTLTAVFRASFPATPIFPATSAEVLRMDQSYTIRNGTQIDPDPMAAFGGGPHPLAVIKGFAGMSNAGPIGAAVITLRTEFVDIEPFWQVYADYWTVYQRDRHPNARFVPLGYTGGSPIVWLVSMPDSCTTSSNAAVSCLTFFRPENYEYTRVNEQHLMSAMGRYLCAPKKDSDPSASVDERDHVVLYQGYNDKGEPETKTYAYVRCGFENALVKSGRAVVMIHPWPSGGQFGKAVTKDLPLLCEQILRNLWARKFICRNVANVGLGRLGLSGYSRGGLALWKALAANRKSVEELYLFDCNETKTSEIVQWYKSIAKDPRLRMVGGAYNVVAHNTIMKAIGPNSNVTAVLDDPKWADTGAHPYWDHAIRYLNHFINKPKYLPYKQGIEHQFAIFGGEHVGLGTEVETFLCQFLKSSAF